MRHEKDEDSVVMEVAYNNNNRDLFFIIIHIINGIMRLWEQWLRIVKLINKYFSLLTILARSLRNQNDKSHSQKVQSLIT